MKTPKRASTEIAIRLKITEGQKAGIGGINNYSVQYKNDDGQWLDADSKSAKRVMETARLLDIQTITLAYVKQNPCYIVVWIGNKPYMICVPCR
jgi:hypothetical protein